MISFLHPFKFLISESGVCPLTQSCLTLCDPMDCSLPGSSVHGIFQARILEWAVISLPGNLLDLEVKPASPALAGGFFTTELSPLTLVSYTKMCAKSHTSTRSVLLVLLYSEKCSATM